MSVIVQRHGDVGMAHDVLQVFGVHSSLGKPSAESVPHGMGRDVRQGLIRLVVLVVLPDKPLEHALVWSTFVRRTSQTGCDPLTFQYAIPG